MDDFDRFRSEMNEKLLGSGHLGIKRFLPWIRRPMKKELWTKRPKS